MIKRLDATNLEALLHLFNTMYAAGFVPEEWKEALVAPLLKPSKPKTAVNSYRPISLTSCLGKVMERMINSRLRWHLDKINYLPKHQTGFRKGCTIMDNVTGLETAVKLAFNRGRVTTAVFLDLSKAYDATWVTGLLYKLTKAGIKGPLLNWLHNFLTDRSIQVRVGNSLSDKQNKERSPAR